MLAKDPKGNGRGNVGLMLLPKRQTHACKTNTPMGASQDSLVDPVPTRRRAS
jgi:hypothetical protein